MRSLSCAVVLAMSGVAWGQAPVATVEEEVQRPPRLLGRLHLSAFGFGEILARQLGAQVGASFSLGSYFDVGAAVMLGRDIGYRVDVTVHPGPAWTFRPFGQLRGIIHPGGGGVAFGVGAVVGASVQLGPGRIVAGAGPEFYLVAASSYRPIAVLAMVGYELDLFAPADADGDRIPDDRDACPDEAELFNGVDDADGCPDSKVTTVQAPADTDGDGVVDALDKCAHEAEDRDGVQDEDGCPDPDNDGDGIADRSDFCPLEAETLNGVDDADGCPEKEASAFIEKTAISTRIVIRDKVFFQTGSHKILPKSFGILTRVAEILKRFPQIKKLRVEGHTDDIGNDELNVKLSTRRAQSVMAFLVLRGVEPARLEFEGFGKHKPLVPGDTDEVREANRRVEFVLVDPPEFTPTSSPD
ncbi:MAG: OmpA family protein [Archangium sp.]|nr:OmpA family protein [Archangium sp.]